MSLVECLVFVFQLSFLTLGKASYIQSIHIKWKVQFVYSALLSANKHTMECRYLTQLLTSLIPRQFVVGETAWQFL